MINWAQKIVISLALLSCGVVVTNLLQGFPTATAQSEPPNRYQIEMILKARANPQDFWRIVEQGALVAAEEFSIDLTVTGAARESDIEGQIQLVREAMARAPDAMVVSAADYHRLVPVCGEVTAAGIPLIIVDSDIDSPDKTSFVGPDNHLVGRKMAEVVESVIGPDERFGVIGHVPGSFTCMAREEGLMEGLEYPSRLAAVEYCNGSASVAMEQCIEMLTQYPDIRCMVGLNEMSALGISYGLYEMGLSGDVKVVACDSSEQQIRFMEDGTIQAFVIQNPFNMGYLSLKAAVDVVNGRSVEAVIDTGSIVIFKEDINKKENQKLLFPFTEE